jgi:hypothetical protein
MYCIEKRTFAPGFIDFYFAHKGNAKIYTLIFRFCNSMIEKNTSLRQRWETILYLFEKMFQYCLHRNLTDTFNKNSYQVSMYILILVSGRKK